MNLDTGSSDIEFENILLKILDLINFNEDKTKFARKFISLCAEKTLVTLLNSLPTDTVNKVNATLQTKNSEEKIELLKKIVDRKIFIEAYFKNRNDLLNEYITSIASTLSQEQKNKLAEYLLSISSKEK